MKALAICIPLMLLTACATPDQSHPGGEAARDTKSKTPQKFEDALTSPLADLNLVRTPIPDILHQAQIYPYAAPTDQTCDSLTAQVQALNIALGADLDAATGPQASDLEKGVDALENVTMAALKGTFEGFVPFRGWIRKISGAESYAREVVAAIAAGTVRRAYLKGLGQARGCQPPAAPREPSSQPPVPPLPLTVPQAERSGGG